jgi:hypothetical protein
LFTDRNSPHPSSETRDDTRWRSLEELLQYTLRMDYPVEPLSPKDREALKEVAREHSGKPFTLEPVAVALVQALLSSFFSSWGKNPALWRPMATRVAHTLFEDGHSQRRLKRVWLHSCEGG